MAGAPEVSRTQTEELKQKIEAGEEAVVVVDLRHSLDFEAEPQTIPGAIRLAPEQVEEVTVRFLATAR